MGLLPLYHIIPLGQPLYDLPLAHIYVSVGGKYLPAIARNRPSARRTAELCPSCRKHKIFNQSRRLKDNDYRMRHDVGGAKPIVL